MNTTLKLTVAEYDEMVARGAFEGLNKRIELIYGEIQAMNPAGPIHDDYIEYLTRWSYQNANTDEVRIRVQSGLSLPELDSRPEPDVLWVKSRRYTDGHPQAADVLLLIEVSDSSLTSDRNEKAKLYAGAGISEYWIINVPDDAIHVYRQPAESGYQMMLTVKPGETVAPLVQPDAALNVSELFCGE